MKFLLVVLYFIVIWLLVMFGISDNFFIISAVLLWSYMAINIWANDVANSVGPAVGSKALTIKWAIIIAAFWNIAGATIAWWEVVKTVKKWIIDVSTFNDPIIFIFVMLAALIAAALWLNIATYLKAPVSTTHSIVWWVMGSWIAAMWFWIVSWINMTKIAWSWVTSPLIWWIIAAIFLYSIKSLILRRTEKVKYAKKWVPLFVAIMSWAFVTYLIIKGLKNVVKLDFVDASHYWLLTAILVYIVVRTYFSKFKKNIENSRESIAKLFTIPLIFAVTLLSFAHGANDVANAIWPLAAIYDSVMSWSISTKVWIPFWILLMGWIWIAVWLSLFGPRIIKTVWREITEIDQIRAFCIALSAAITVIIASQLWLPVSSTHIALGWVFGVWFLRERLHKKDKWNKVQLVERSIFKKIIAAWLITVPAVALISGITFHVLIMSFL